MSDPKPTTCDRCGARIPARGAEQLCPACLLSGALATPDDVSPTETPGRASISAEEGEYPRQLGGYRLLGRLGSGGMGTVFEAEDLATGRRVALKRLDHAIDSPQARQRFLREGRLAASVNHPNSLYVFGSEEIEDTPVITMEVAAGGTLQDLLDRSGPLPVPDAVDAILDVIAGLEAAHACGVLHRDVKPSNCFVGPDGSVKVGDFGLSMSTLPSEDTFATAAGTVMGTPAFAPPEQLRGDELDVRSDIYSVGATISTLLTGQAPFTGRNVVQVVAHAMNQPPRPLSELAEGVHPGLERVVARCLAKSPDGRFADYRELRDALLPFSSREPEPASMRVRAAAGWVDYLIAFLVPYVTLMVLVGNDEFHLGFLLERTAASAWPHIVFLGFGILYFTLAEGLWGAGFGKRLKQLRVIRPGGQAPGLARALIRIFLQVLSIEGVRIPLLLATISATRIDEFSASEVAIYSTATTLCVFIPVLLGLTARRGNGFATVWDRVSGTRVVVKPRGAVRPSLRPPQQATIVARTGAALGPYQVVREVVAGAWIEAVDPVLRRRVWLLRRASSGPSDARRRLARPGRLRWLQDVDAREGIWDAFEAPAGAPFSSRVSDGGAVPWDELRFWLHDVAAEMWAATRDRTIPPAAGFDQVWITAQGQAVLLDVPWPEVSTAGESLPVDDLAGQQRFLSSMARCADSTSLPLHARPVLRNLEQGRFEKLSYLTGTLQGLLDKPVGVSPGLRAGAIFLLPLYVWTMIFVGARQGADWLYDLTGEGPLAIASSAALAVLIGAALIQLLELPFRTTFSHAIFRLAVIDASGEHADALTKLQRWAITWLPLFLPAVLLMVLLEPGGAAYAGLVSGLILLWMGAAAYGVMHPNRGLHDRLAGTWVVRC